MRWVGSQLAYVKEPPCWPGAADPPPLELLLHAAATNVTAMPTTRTRSEPLIDQPPMSNGPSCNARRASTNRDSVLDTRNRPKTVAIRLGPAARRQGTGLAGSRRRPTISNPHG